MFGAASEAFSQKNTNCSIEEGIERFREVCEAAAAADVQVRGYVSCVVGCPYQGEVPPDAVAMVSEKLLDMGCYEVSLGDTIGVGTPGSVRNMLRGVKGEPSHQMILFGRAFERALALVPDPHRPLLGDALHDTKQR